MVDGMGTKVHVGVTLKKETCFRLEFNPGPPTRNKRDKREQTSILIVVRIRPSFWDYVGHVMTEWAFKSYIPLQSLTPPLGLTHSYIRFDGYRIVFLQVVKWLELEAVIELS
jgi:hypothetical protein